MERRKRIESGGEGQSELNRQIERIQRDLTRRERELEEERRETERTLDRLRASEKDKIELKRELDEVRDEITEYQHRIDELEQNQDKVKGHAKTQAEDERLASLRATLQERNRETSLLLQDLEKLEEEKTALKAKLTEVSFSLEDATDQMTSMTKDRSDLKVKLTKVEEQVGKLEEEKAVLQIRERELLDFKEQHDQHLEHLGNAVDIRVDVWKKMMFQKDEEIERLSSKVEALLRKSTASQLNSENQATVQHLNMKLHQRDDHIRQLAEQLQEATEELNNNNKVIQSLQVQLPHGGSGEDSDRVVRSLEKKVRKLESKLEKRTEALALAEKDAEEKTGETVVLMSRLRQYESGQYGLSDAVAEIKDLKNQLKIRDRELEKLTQEVNQFQIEGAEVVEENEMLRRRLGHGLEEDLSHQRRHFGQKRSDDVNSLKAQLEVKENEVTTLKTRNYELKRLLSTAQEQIQGSMVKVPTKDEAIGQTPPIMSFSLSDEPPPEVSDHWREKYDIILHENTELRRGLQEILDSFQRFGESEASNIRIESPILENLLREMSARGLINYPYSISSFHLKVCNLEGKNSQLREELQRTRMWAEGLIEKEKQRCEEWREKAIAAQEIVKSAQAGDKSEFLQRVNHSQLETGRWKRIAEQSEKLISMLNEKVEESDTKVIQLESKLELLKKTKSPSIPLSPPKRLESTGVQADLPAEKDVLEAAKSLKSEQRIIDLENLLTAKDEVIENLKNITSSYELQPVRTKPVAMSSNPELEEALQLARESIQALTERLKAKEENLMSYKRILAEVRGEMQLATERHVQDMNTLQSIIHQQQQAFTRMKSSLSHPVRDTQDSDIEGILREQLTRINELEECVRDLEHTMGNVASQLATARTDAHRWRVTADTRLKEIDLLREQLGIGDPVEIGALHSKIKIQEETISGLKQSHTSASILKELLEEKEIEIQALRTASATLRTKGPVSHRSDLAANRPMLPPAELSSTQLATMDHLRQANQELEAKLKKLQVRLSKINATNRASGMTQEMEKLRADYSAVLEEKEGLRSKLAEMEQRMEDDLEKNRKTVDGYARWDEGKKWKRTVERLEDQKRKLEEERSQLNKLVEQLRSVVTRLEKEKLLQESRLRKGIKSSTSEASLADDEGGKHHKEIERLQGLLSNKDLSTNETLERMTMEAQILRERICTQERQLTAYEVSNKGDPKVVTEIQKLVQSNDKLHQELVNQQQTNLDLKLQIQEMKLETPKLRDRVQTLQKMADVLKSGPGKHRVGALTNSGKNLGELEKTIAALKTVVEKLDKNKAPQGIQLKASKSVSKHDAILAERERLLEKVATLEEIIAKAERVQLENEARIGDLLGERDEARNRASSAEMKLKTFLDQDRTKGLEVEIQRKTQLLSEAKKSLEEFTKGRKSTRN